WQAYYTWYRRYQAEGADGLRTRSKAPKHSPNATHVEVVGKIIHLRQNYHFGPEEIAMYLKRYHDVTISKSGVWRILNRLDMGRLPASQRYKRHDRRRKRYEKQLPGHRVQIDVKFIEPLASMPQGRRGGRNKYFQFTAIDDCTRLRVLRIYPTLDQNTAIQFLDYVIQRLPFQVEVIQTDNVAEFQSAFHWHVLDHNIPLADLTQTDVDMWLSESRDRRHVRLFLRWAHQRRLTGKHEVPDRPRDEPHRWWTETEHWTQLQRCLHDEALPADVRATGALVLLYGMPITRIATLTRSDLTDGIEPRLLMGTHPAALPPVVYQLLLRQAERAEPNSAIGRVPPRTAWLFPGYAAGTHRSAADLARKLRLHELPARTGRNTAPLALAADLPASVLSETLGLSITAALKWTRRATRDWNAYLAARPTPRLNTGPPTKTNSASGPPPEFKADAY
ncbi:helix-turn-helix domain-containing protein, partial [Streptomyces sp. NL15-2K]